MPAAGKVNGRWLVEGDVILVQLINGTHIPAARVTADGVIPAVVVAVASIAATGRARASRRITVQPYAYENGTLTLTGSVADVHASASQTFWHADHFATWRDRGVPRSVDLSAV